MRKNIFLVILLMSGAPSWATILGKEGGGGDPCESRIRRIRDDLSAWIQDGGPLGLKLPAHVSVETYSKAMLEAMNEAKIKCVGPGDKGYPVLVAGTPKVCRFEQSAQTREITCDMEKLNSQREEDLYPLVHHEYAGLAQLERAIGARSDYQLSNQISAYLTASITRKLRLLPTASSARAKDLINLGWTPTLGYDEAIRYCHSIGGHVPTFTEFVEMAAEFGAQTHPTQFAGVDYFDPRNVDERRQQKKLGFRPIWGPTPDSRFYLPTAYYYASKNYSRFSLKNFAPNALVDFYWISRGWDLARQHSFFFDVSGESGLASPVQIGDKRQVAASVVCLPGVDSRQTGMGPGHQPNRD